MAASKALLGDEATGASPTDRGKSATKRHHLTEAAGLPIGIVVTGANRHDKTQAGRGSLRAGAGVAAALGLCLHVTSTYK